MTLTLHFHPLASYCWKVLIALYEAEAPFESTIVDLGEARSRAAFLQAVAGRQDARADGHRGDKQRSRNPPSSSNISQPIIQAAANSSRPMWTWPAASGSPTVSTTSMSTSTCRRSSATGCGLRGKKIRSAWSTPAPRWRPPTPSSTRTWPRSTGPRASRSRWPIVPHFPRSTTPTRSRLSPGTSPSLAGYFERLSQRPSVMRVLREAEPYFAMFPASEEA